VTRPTPTLAAMGECSARSHGSAAGCGERGLVGRSSGERRSDAASCSLLVDCAVVASDGVGIAIVIDGFFDDFLDSFFESFFDVSIMASARKVLRCGVCDILV